MGRIKERKRRLTFFFFLAVSGTGEAKTHVHGTAAQAGRAERGTSPERRAHRGKPQRACVERRVTLSSDRIRRQFVASPLGGAALALLELDQGPSALAHLCLFSALTSSSVLPVPSNSPVRAGRWRDGHLSHCSSFHRASAARSLTRAGVFLTSRVFPPHFRLSSFTALFFFVPATPSSRRASECRLS